MSCDKTTYGDDDVLWVSGGVEGILDAGLLLSSTGTCSAGFCSSQPVLFMDSCHWLTCTACQPGHDEKSEALFGPKTSSLIQNHDSYTGNRHSEKSGDKVEMFQLFTNGIPMAEASKHETDIATCLA